MTTTMVPTVPGWPLLGSLPDVRRDMLGLFDRAAELGDVVLMKFPGRVAHLIVHPDQVKQVLVDDHRKFGKQTRGYQMLRIALGQGLVTSEGDFWRRQRRIAQPAFHHQRIQAFAELMAKATAEMLDDWQTRPAGSVIDVDEEMMAVTLRIVGLALMGVDLCDETDAVGASVTSVLEETVHRITHPLTPPLFVPTRRNRRLRSALSTMHQMIGDLIAARRRVPGEHADLLGMLMDARDEETGEGMTDEQLRDEVMTMVSAGHETTANTLSWALHLLCGAPEAEATLAAEVKQVLGGEAPSLESLGRLAFTEAAVKESMRLRPPVWMLARSVEAPVTVKGVELPMGSMVFLAPWLTHRDARFWSQPLQYRPQRFLNGETDEQPKYAYFPFSGGPRMCIGNSFAMMEAKILLSAIIQRFTLQAVPGEVVVPEPTITLRPKDGLRMRLMPRDSGEAA